MLNLKKLIIKALVSEIKISDTILIAADNAIRENEKGHSKVSSSTKTEVSK